MERLCKKNLKDRDHLAGPRCRWEVIKIYLNEIRLEAVTEFI
jgi:hypothetical protein